GRSTRPPITTDLDETDAKEWVQYTPTECVSKMERGKITNRCSCTHIHHSPLYFFCLFFGLYLHKRGFISFSNMKVVQGIIKKGMYGSYIHRTNTKIKVDFQPSRIQAIA
ncbi:hypothetical protein, partial [Anoxybacillus flavithermus]|uniref:hypothetical protein n=1 Tax=Anoxybacillus flavithermus TaxID=33934 RepID=UPI0019D593E5